MALTTGRRRPRRAADTPASGGSCFRFQRTKAFLGGALRAARGARGGAPLRELVREPAQRGEPQEEERRERRGVEEEDGPAEEKGLLDREAESGRADQDAGERDHDVRAQVADAPEPAGVDDEAAASRAVQEERFPQQALEATLLGARDVGGREVGLH